MKRPIFASTVFEGDLPRMKNLPARADMSERKSSQHSRSWDFVVVASPPKFSLFALERDAVKNFV